MRAARSLLLVGLALSGRAGAQALVSDIATDTNDASNLGDTEPSIAVNPTNPLDIAIVTFSENWSSTTSAPVWKSRDGGFTWTKITQIGQPGTSAGPNDQKLAFSSNGNIHVAELDLAFSDYVFRQSGGADAALAAGASYGNDQPHLDIDRGSGACANVVYSPWLNTSLGLNRSMVEDSATDGVTVAAVNGGDNSSFSNRTTRIAIAPDGKAYIIYKTREGSVDTTFENAHFHVNRSDDCGATWSALGAGGTQPSGSSQVQTFFTTSWGNSAKGKVARARSSDAWIATDPVTGDVYAAFVEKDASGFGQIYVARSNNSASSWMTPVRVTDGTHNCAYPEIAVASNGNVGVLYVDYDDSGAATLFRHHFSRSFNLGANWSDETLQSMDPAGMTNAGSGFLWGDYEGLTALGNTFYGVFTGGSTGRTTSQLDPIFFREGAVATGADFYVRDWTDTAMSGDNGMAPSTHSVFYHTSDVWNQRTPSTSMQFNANNQPINETPVPGVGAAGSNFAFARIFRNSGGAATNVTAHFMFSEFGTGSSYTDLGNESVAFAAADTQKITTAHSWHLDPTASTHLCLAVELSASGDPFVPPTLLGRTPGWPATDLMVIGDNNKAQRNMGVYPATEGGPITEYAVIHNGATFPRNMVIGYTAEPGVMRSLMGATVGVVDGASQPFKPGGSITLKDMQPGENRWVYLTYTLGKGELGQLPVYFHELRDGKGVNGFGIIAHRVTPIELARDNLRFQHAILTRVHALYNLEPDKEEVLNLEHALARHAPTVDEYVGIARTHAEHTDADWVKRLAGEKLKDSLGLHAAVLRVATEAKSGNVGRIAMAHAALLHKVDAALTMLAKRGGDAADVLQNVLWQEDLYRKATALKSDAREVLGESDKFVNGFRARKLGAKDYPPLIKQLLGVFRREQTAHPELKLDVEAMEKNLDSPARLQKAHREFLLKLQPLAIAVVKVQPAVRPRKP